MAYCLARVPSGTEPERGHRGASRPERPVDAGAGRSGSLPGRNLAGWGPRACRRSGECFQARDSGRQLRSAGNKTRTNTLVSSRRSGGEHFKKAVSPGRAAPGRSARSSHGPTASLAAGGRSRGRSGPFRWPGLGAELARSPLLAVLARSYTSFAGALLGPRLGQSSRCSSPPGEDGRAKSRDGSGAHLFV